MELNGRLIRKENTVAYSDKFRSRKFVIETGGDYPQFISCELHQDKCDLLDGLVKGTEVSIKVDIRGRKWSKDGEEKYFNTIVCYVLDIGVSVEKEVLGSDNLPF